LKPETESAPTRQDIGHEIGQDNVEIFGLDVHNPVFMISAAMAVAFVLGTLLFLDAAGPAFSNLRVWITSRFDWLFMIGSNIFVVFSLFIAYSKLGRVRLPSHATVTRAGWPCFSPPGSASV
jgi:BCCT family betaine/carnitine transporter